MLFLDETGRVTVWRESEPEVLDTTIFCNSAIQGPESAQWGLEEEPDSCMYHVFCSGNTTDRDGNFIFMGGAALTGHESLNGSCAITYFDPTKMNGIDNPWTPGPNMENKRWYGGIVTMLKAYEGRPFIIGGTAGTSGVTVGLGTRDWERLKPIPFTGEFKNCSGAEFCPSELDQPPSSMEGALNDPDNATQLEYFPRIHQLAGTYGEFFIAGDTQPSFVNCDPGSLNEPGDMWFLRPPPNDQSIGKLKRAPFFDDDSGVPMNRYYGSSVMLHQLPANGGTNRVLVFGGSNGCIGDSGVCDCPGSSDGTTVQVRSSVKELNYVPGTNPNDDPGVHSSLIDKESLRCGRVYSNAVVLPTGEIFISRGSANDPYVTDAPDTAEPHRWAEIYNPGPTKTSAGSSEWTAEIPSTFANWDTSVLLDGPALCQNAAPPRIYHHLAMLLPSGRVLVAGGDEVPGFPSSGLCPPTGMGPYGSSSYTGELYKPPYFHKNFSVQITGAESTATFLGTTTIACKIVGAPTTAYIDRVVFIKTGALTHHQDMSQVYVEATFEVTAVSYDGKAFVLAATVPRSTLMPPGYYMLFVVGRNGADRVPSQGAFIKVD